MQEHWNAFGILKSARVRESVRQVQASLNKFQIKTSNYVYNFKLLTI